jgi:hypothetical protein
MTLPNLVIAGAPKCGTTSLFSWLTAHPDVCGARVKETQFLLDPDDPLFKEKSNFRDHGLDGYRSYFSHCGSAPIVVEATPTYLYQETALEVLASLHPLPQIIFVLRKPSERVYSHYQFIRNNHLVLDPALSFRDFVALAKVRDSRLPTRAHAREIVAQSRYIDYLEPWASRFPRSHLHIFLFEQLARSKSPFMRAVAQRIGIDPGFYDCYDYPRENETYRVRFRRLHRTRKRVARQLSPQLRATLKGMLEGGYSRLNLTKGADRTSDETEVLLELDREFVPYNKSLASEMAIDLTLWS